MAIYKDKELVSLKNTFTVVIPCWNQAKLLPRAVNSLCGNKLATYEVIIVNDGSPDNTKTVAENLMMQLPVVKVLNKQNGGLSSARNAGLDMATGTWMLFLDADDYMLEGALDKALAFIESNRDVDWFYTGHTIEDCSGSEVSRSVGFPLPEKPVARLLEGNLMPVHGVFAKRSLFQTFGGFATELKSCEDWDRWITFALHDAKLGQMPEPCAVYVDYPDSMSTNYLQMVTSAVIVLEKASLEVTRLGRDDLFPHLRRGLGNIRPWMFQWILAPQVERSLMSRSYFSVVNIVVVTCVRDSRTGYEFVKFFYRRLKAALRAWQRDAAQRWAYRMSSDANQRMR